MDIKSVQGLQKQQRKVQILKTFSCLFQCISFCALSSLKFFAKQGFPGSGHFLQTSIMHQHLQKTAAIGKGANIKNGGDARWALAERGRQPLSRASKSWPACKSFFTMKMTPGMSPRHSKPQKTVVQRETESTLYGERPHR